MQRVEAPQLNGIQPRSALHDRLVQIHEVKPRQKQLGLFYKC